MERALFNDYDEAVSYILEIPRFSVKNDMITSKRFLKLIGEGNAESVIHVAGTNGKGSTCAFLNSIFIKQNKKTGLFTSPHLNDIRERIRVNNELISKDDFLSCALYVMEKLKVMRRHVPDYHPSFFEFMFFMAVRYFAINDVDVAIYETGLGGRLDATNTVSRKNVCVITEIGMDHTEYLGDTFGKIAAEKAGILMKGVPVVYWDGRSECSAVISERAALLGCKAFPVNEKNADITAENKKNIDFSYKYGYDKSAMFMVYTYARYQVWNALLALRTIQVLQGDDSIDTQPVRDGISAMTWPGRMEEIQENIFLDGGHNEDGIAAFIDSVLRDGCTGRRRLIYSAVNDKRIESISRMLAGSKAFDAIAVCGLKNSRATGVDKLARIFEDSIADAHSRIALTVYKDAESAYEGEKKSMSDDDKLYICGSLYLIADIREYTEAGKDDQF